MAGRATQNPSGYRERNSTADRALDVLQLFSEDRLVLSGVEISEHLGVARSTGYRYLQSLVGAGFIEDTIGGFRLGPRIFELARLARKGIGLSDVALPEMRALAAQTHETALLTRRSGDVVVCLDRVEADQPIHISYDRGHVLPINAGAAAEVLLAWEDPDEVAAVLGDAPLRRFTSKTLTDPQRLHARLDRIRKRGVAVSRGELDQDVIGVAAPIFGGDGVVRAAVSVAALAARVPVARVAKVEHAVMEAAARISQQLALVES